MRRMKQITMKKRMPLRFAAALGVASLLIRAPVAAEPDFRTDINPALLYFQAFQNIPHLSEADSKYLFDSPVAALPEETLDERRADLLKQFDNSFKLTRRARFSRVPCDWGYDLSDGPEALLPGLAPARRLGQAARLRAMAALDAGQFNALRDDFAAAVALGRNVATDHILISCLVQIAIENSLSSVVMENYYRLSADQLDQLVAVFDSPPRRGTVAETMPTEREFFFGYVERKVAAMIDESHGNSEMFWSRFEPFWNPIATDSEAKIGPDPSADRIKEAAEGTPAGVLRLLGEMPTFYSEAARIMSLPYAQYKEQSPAFFASISSSPNPFIAQFFTAFKKVRAKEFSAIVRQEMVRAAAAYKRGGTAALQSVQDPLIGGAFEFGRVQFQGVDRGFRLKSRESFRDFDEVMIFVEKPGKRFQLDGKNAGTGF
jgi:hypothetical protein